MVHLLQQEVKSERERERWGGEMPSIRVLNVDRILPSRGPYPPPGDAVPLSFFDTCWIALPPIRRVFLYPDATSILFPSVLERLKSSLSETLLLYHPLAGKLTHLPASGDVVVDCSPAAVGEGVAFIEAGSDADIRRLASEETHDVEAFFQLVPELDVRVLPAPVFAVQMTRFTGDGVAIGFAAHHAVVDGQAVWRFLEAWAGACKGGEPPAVPARPSHDRSVVRCPGSEEIARRYLRHVAPALPQTTAPSPPIQNQPQMTRRTFAINAETIKSLKEAGRRDPASQPSTFISISAHAWISFAHAKEIKNDEACSITFSMDCRSRLDPPLDEEYTGNCVRALYVKATGSELRGVGGHQRACTAIAHAIQEFADEPLRGCEDWVDVYLRHASVRNMFVVGSPRFRAYEMDFGWGRPSRVELVSMNHDGVVALQGGKEEGEVQVSVSISAIQMNTFASVFAGGQGCCSP